MSSYFNLNGSDSRPSPLSLSAIDECAVGTLDVLDINLKSKVILVDLREKRRDE